MPTYTVHVHREMRLKFTGVEAESMEDAAKIGADLRTDQAAEIGDCAGANLYALVDIEDDEDFEHSSVVDFEAGRMVDSGPAMLRALELAVAALNCVSRFPVPGLLTCSYRIAATCDHAIAKAKGAAS
jgi:hypothetical protein